MHQCCVRYNVTDGVPELPGAADLVLAGNVPLDPEPAEYACRATCRTIRVALRTTARRSVDSCVLCAMVPGASADYLECMSATNGPANMVADAAAAGTARLLAAWCAGSPRPEAAERRCERVANLAARRAWVWQALFFTNHATVALAGQRDAGPGPGEIPGASEMIYDGASAQIRAVGGWTGLLMADPAARGSRMIRNPRSTRPVWAIFSTSTPARSGSSTFATSRSHFAHDRRGHIRPVSDMPVAVFG